MRFKLLLAFFMMYATTNFADIITSTQSGDWSLTSTWVGGVVPGATDDVIIADGHTITTTVARSFLSLVMQGNAKLIISGAVTSALPTGAAYTFSTSSTIEYQGAGGANTIVNINHPNIIINAATAGTAKTWSPTGNRTCYSITVTQGIFSFGNGVQLSVSGDIIVSANGTIAPGSSANRFVAIGSNRTFTLNGTARVTSNETQTAAALLPFSYQYNNFSTYTFASSSWISFRSPTSAPVTQGISGIAGSPFGNVEIAAITNLGTPGSNTHVFKGNVEIAGNLAFPRIVANTSLSIDFSSFTVKVGGKIQLSGSNTSTQSGGRTYTTTNSTFELNGLSSQTTLGGTDLPSTFNNLTINNSSGVTLENSITVNGTLSLQDGVLNRNGKTLTLNGTVTGVGLSGISESQSLNAPSSANIGNLGLAITSGENLGSTTVIRGYSSLTANGNQSILRWYRVVPTNNTGLNATIVFPYEEGAELNGIAESKLRLFRSTDNGTTWILAGGIVDESANAVTISGVDQFSLWTLGDVDNPLPVELSSFTSSVSGQAVNLTWSTATEVDNYGFEVQKSENQSDWSTIGFVHGSGNSNSNKQYAYTDQQAGTGTIYYRLKQIDNAGTFKVYDPITVEVEIPKDFTLSQNYPNPFNPATTINYTLPTAGSVTLQVYSMNGELVQTLVQGYQAAGSYSVAFDASRLASGTYAYRLITTGADGQTHSALKKMLLMK